MQPLIAGEPSSPGRQENGRVSVLLQQGAHGAAREGWRWEQSVPCTEQWGNFPPAGVPDLDKAQKMSPGQVPCSRKEDAFCWKQGAAPLVTPEGDKANGDSLEVFSLLLPVV